MSDTAIVIAFALCFYPAIVLLIAWTGPHSRYEKEERHDQ